MKKLITLIISLLCANIIVFAQQDDSRINADVQLRSRAELRDGALMPKTDEDSPAAFINNRTRLNMNYANPKFEIGLSVQHVGVWGDDKQVHKGANFGVHEAWSKLALNEQFFVKLGRQTLSYDDQRILGALDWHVAGRHHDALKLGYENNKHKLHLIVAYNQNNENVHGNFYDMSKGQPYKTMQTLWYNVHATPRVNLSFLAMNLGLQAEESVENMQTLGTYMELGLFPQSNLTLSGYYQMGTLPSKKSVSAYMLSGIFDYRFTDKMKGKIGMDFLSGDDGMDADKTTAFNPLYGTHHKFYGTMDYFYVSPFINGYNPGLWDSYIGLSTVINPKFSLGLTYHYFRITADVPDIRVDKVKDLEKGLGSEVDIDMKWKIHKDVTLTGGFSFALLSDAMNAVKGGDTDKFQSWTWLSLNVSPNLFRR